ncbi:MAG: hypothetical protein ACOYNS_00565 [Bacteroidota bacterium]
MRILSVCFMIIVGVILVSAQPNEMKGGRFQRPMERLEQYKKIRMIEALKLDEETGLKLVGRYNKHRENVKQLEENRAALVEKLEAQLKSNAADSELQRSFNEFYEIEKKIGESRKKFLEDLKEIFTNKQIAEYMVFERNFMTDLRNTVKDIQKERRQRE